MSRYEYNVITNLEGKIEDADELEFSGSAPALFGMDRSDSLYQRDQAKLQKGLEQQRLKEEEERLNEFRLSSARRAASANPVIPIVAKKIDKDYKLSAVVGTKIVPLKKRTRDDSFSHQPQIEKTQKKPSVERAVSIPEQPGGDGIGSVKSVPTSSLVSSSSILDYGSDSEGEL